MSLLLPVSPLVPSLLPPLRSSTIYLTMNLAWPIRLILFSRLFLCLPILLSLSSPAPHHPLPKAVVGPRPAIKVVAEVVILLPLTKTSFPPLFLLALHVKFVLNLLTLSSRTIIALIMHINPHLPPHSLPITLQLLPPLLHWFSNTVATHHFTIDFSNLNLDSSPYNFLECK